MRAISPEKAMRKAQLYFGDKSALQSASERELITELKECWGERHKIELDGRRKNPKLKERSLEFNMDAIWHINSELLRQHQIKENRRTYAALFAALKRRIEATSNFVPLTH